MSDDRIAELKSTLRMLERIITNRDVEIYRLRNERGRLEAKLDTYDQARLDQAVFQLNIQQPPGEKVVLRAQAEELAHALDHVIGCRSTCEQCRKVAASAMAHDNLADFLEGT
jgi:hypothetical protein